MITHKEYMADAERLHHAYYLEIAEECHISYRNSHMLPDLVRILSEGDEYLNRIPLSQWDAIANSMMMYSGRALKAAMEARGTWLAQATLVCIAKAAARQAALEAMNMADITWPELKAVAQEMREETARKVNEEYARYYS